MELHEDRVCLLAGENRLKHNYKDPDVLPKTNKSDMAETMEAIGEFLRSCHSVTRAPLAYILGRM